MKRGGLTLARNGFKDFSLSARRVSQAADIKEAVLLKMLNLRMHFEQH